jgi:hypothetical protein
MDGYGMIVKKKDRGLAAVKMSPIVEFRAGNT